MQTLKANKYLLIWTLIYIGISGYLIWTDLSYLTLFPIALVVIYCALFYSDKTFLALALLTPLSINIEEYSDSFGLYLPTEPLLFGLLLLGLWQELRATSLNIVFWRSPIVISVSVYLFWMFITSITSSSPLISFKFLLAHLWLIVPVLLYGFSIFQKKKNIVIFMWLFTIGMVIVITYTLIIHASYRFGEKESHWVMWPFFKDHTIYGAAIGIVVPLVFGLYFYKKHNAIIQAILLSFISIILIGLYFSYTRGAWLSVIAAIGVWGLIKIRFKFSWIAGLLVIAGLILFSNWTEITHRLEKNKSEHTTENFSKRVQSAANVTSDASNLERLNRWQCALDMVSERPWVGFGPGTYAFEYARFQRPQNLTIISTNFGNGGNAHSEYLGAMAETGAIGMLTVFALVACIFYQSISLYNKWPEDDREIRTLLMATILSLVTYFVHGLLNNYLDTDKASVPIYAMCAITLALEYKWIKNHKKKGVIA